MPESNSQDTPAAPPEEAAPSAPTNSEPENESGEASETEDSIEDLSPFLQSIEAPLNEENPAGKSVTYDEDFQSLKTEIENIGSASGRADYERIVELARGILTEKSKDLRAAGYLVIGEARANGADRMAEAVRAVRLLINTYWEDLYPAKRRMRGRGSTLQFISDRLSDWVSSADFERTDRAVVVAARDDLKAIQDFGLQEMGKHAPALSGLLNELDDVIGSLPEPEPEESPSEELDAAASEPDEEDVTSPDTPSASTDLTSESDASTAVVRAATFLREQDLTDPIPYHLLRAVQWGVLREPPPDDGGETRLPSPREQRRTYLRELLEDDEYETLIRESESSLQNEPFHLWLDLQRLIASALDALGASYELARDAVLFDVARLVDRLPGLLGLTFRDGTPFASPITVDWIETQVRPVLSDGDGDEEGSTTSGDHTLPVTKQYEKARQLLSGGDLDEALTLMRDGAAEDISGKEAFHRRFYIAELCVKGNKFTVARPLLDELDAEIEKHSLDLWRPSLALEVWENKYKCYDALAETASGENQGRFSEEADVVFSKICRLDAVEGLSVAKRRSTAG